MAWRISSSQKITGDGWRAQGAERAGGEVAASKLAEPCEQGTGGRDHSQCDGRPRTQAEVGNVCRVREDLARGAHGQRTENRHSETHTGSAQRSPASSRLGKHTCVMFGSMSVFTLL